MIELLQERSLVGEVALRVETVGIMSALMLSLY
jgi:hypothetical protein